MQLLPIFALHCRRDLAAFPRALQPSVAGHGVLPSPSSKLSALLKIKAGEQESGSAFLTRRCGKLKLRALKGWCHRGVRPWGTRANSGPNRSLFISGLMKVGSAPLRLVWLGAPQQGVPWRNEAS
jgi:hypothetical protein